MRLADDLRAAIAASGLSLNELRRRCGVDHGQLSRFVRGERDLTLTNAGRVAGALGLALLPAEAKAPAKPKKARKGK